MHVFNWCINFKISTHFLIFEFLYAWAQSINTKHIQPKHLSSMWITLTASPIFFFYTVQIFSHMWISHTLATLLKYSDSFLWAKKKCLFFGAERQPDIQSAECQMFSNHTNTYILTFTPFDVLNNVWQTVSFSYSPRSVIVWTLSENF